MQNIWHGFRSYLRQFILFLKVTAMGLVLLFLWCLHGFECCVWRESVNHKRCLTHHPTPCKPLVLACSYNHHPSSQGWAPSCAIGLHVCTVQVWRIGSGFPSFSSSKTNSASVQCTCTCTHNHLMVGSALACSSISTQSSEPVATAR